MEPCDILAISGSLRARSSSTEVLRAAATLAPPTARVTLYVGLGTLPHFNPDLDADGSMPPEAVWELRSQVTGAAGILICSPEYAHGVPGALKNALDWLVSGVEILHKPVGILTTAPRATHAIASLAETLRTMSAAVIAGATVALPIDGRRLEAADIVADPELSRMIRASLDSLTAAAVGYRIGRDGSGAGQP